MTYPDVENVLIDLLERDFPALAPTTVRRVDSETPPDLRPALANGGVFVRVVLGGGQDDGVTDYSLVDLDVFADTRASAYAWSTDIRAWLTDGSHRIGGAVLDRAITVDKPRRLPWDDETVRRLGATYRISARR